MTERELFETVVQARHALAQASWGVARAAMEETEGKPGEDALSSALRHWRAARIALGRAHARWEQEAVSTASGSGGQRPAH